MALGGLIKRSLIACAASAALLAAAVRADVKLPAIFSDHMVLQQQMPVPVWGTADPGEAVTVTFGNQKQSSKADEAGKWQVKLNALAASDQPRELTVAGKNSVAFSDVLVGEVWIASGQSNMEFAMRQVKNSAEEIAKANFSNMRLFTVPKSVQAKPINDIDKSLRGFQSWSACTPQSVPGFSAVAYFFGRNLQSSLHVPVGLIHTSWGGTPAEAWTQRDSLEKQPSLATLAEAETHAREIYPEQLKKWEAAAEQAKVDNKPAPRKPPAPEQNPNLATVLYNGMIQPIVPFAARGVIWYQGESNASRAFQYRTLLPTMVQSWRDSWKEPNMSFLIVSLANYQAAPQQPGESDWAELREAQTMTAAMPYNGQALAIDLADPGNPGDIHPKNKQDVGYRLALVALAKTYGQNIPSSGPEFDAAKFEGDKVRLTFKFADGMTAKGGDLKGFQIAEKPEEGQRAKWVWAEAKIEGNSVILSSPDVQKPAAVRYDWANNPQGNLFNKFGLPAVPFRTDKWTGITEKRN